MESPMAEEGEEEGDLLLGAEVAAACLVVRQPL
jgi:hypothetical protein